MDVSALDAIDVHTHVHRSVTAATPEAGQALEAMAAYFKTDAAAYTVDELAQYYRDRNMAAVTFTVDVKDRRSACPAKRSPSGQRRTPTSSSRSPAWTRPAALTAYAPRNA